MKDLRGCEMSAQNSHIVGSDGGIMIELVSMDGLTCPKLFCDSCGEEITDAKQAAVVFSNFMDNTHRTVATYVHKDFVKGDCMAQAEASIRAKGEQSGWEELGEHLAYLISNVGMSLADIEKKLS
jgi:hypothetical protein